MTEIRNIVVLTGAGVSAESGVPTFRAADGLWEGHRVEDVATPQAFRRDPALVQQFYDARRAFLAKVEPNAAHLALARLDAAWPGEFLLVTQNVDDLHERAGSQRLLHMHGELKRALCTGCGAAPAWLDALEDGPPCPNCQAAALRPDIVWFGEMPYHMAEIEEALAACDLFVSIGTSGAVYPAAGFVDVARRAGAATLELNLDPSAGTSMFDTARHGPAGILVPAWVDGLLASIKA
ncbi:NAD-dependent deacylase [Glacieibacterium sp.]|uniref:NAD-dependent deacylase n=1 Tax=Glacieibacterium sp. TaxID=2860237 RepID=UPI003AFFE6E6